MAKPYSDDLRLKMVGMVRSGVSRNQTAKFFQVSVSCVIKLMQRVDATGDVSPAKFGGFRKSPLVEHEADIRGWIKERSDITIADLQSKLGAAGKVASRSAIGRYLQQLGLTLKKRPRLPPSGRARTSPRPAANGPSGRRG